MAKQDKKNQKPEKTEKPDKKDNKTTIILICVSLATVGAVVALLVGAFGLFAGTPALQRSSRDTERRNNVALLESALVSYQTSNSGRRNNLPTVETWSDFLKDYNLDTLTDPDSAEPYLYNLCTYGDSACENPALITSENIGELYVYYGTICASDPETALLEPSTARRFAIVAPLEDGELYCVNN